MDWKSNKTLALVSEEVKRLHKTSQNICIREWFYEGHVLVVADYAAQIAVREKINLSTPVLASLLHDVARTVNVDDEPDLTIRSDDMAREIMAKVGVAEAEADEVCNIMKIHSCRGKVRPDTAEGRVMTTADAMAHLMTDFYLILPFKGWLTATDDFDGYKKWLLEKTQRDLNHKIFFEPERALASPRVQAFQTLFGSV